MLCVVQSTVPTIVRAQRNDHRARAHTHTQTNIYNNIRDHERIKSTHLDFEMVKKKIRKVCDCDLINRKNSLDTKDTNYKRGHN